MSEVLIWNGKAIIEINLVYINKEKNEKEDN
jgi:hypothetical protein